MTPAIIPFEAGQERLDWLDLVTALQAAGCARPHIPAEVESQETPSAQTNERIAVCLFLMNKCSSHVAPGVDQCFATHQ